MKGERIMAIIKTKILAHIGKEVLYMKGEALGLSGEALEVFSCFIEIELLLKVNEKGEVLDVKALWMVDDIEEEIE